MTLRDVFEYVSAHPAVFIMFLMALPALAYLCGQWIAGNEKALPWLNIYAVLVYLACIPGIFAVTLNVYLFLFERQSIWEMNFVTQVLPVLSMVLTLMLIKRKVPFGMIPGFGKLSGFMTIITAMMGIMWFIDRTRIYAITFVPFSYIVVGFVVLLVLIRWGWSKIF
jgi:hypothetical protein